MRPRKKKNVDERLERCGAALLLNPSDHQGNFNRLFSNKNEIHLEIGCGKGSFLAGMAKLYPDINFLALEKVKDVLVLAAERLFSLSLPNAFLFLGDAKDLSGIFAEGEISRIYLNFSDPWPKSRNEKRRLTYKSFLSLYKKILAPGGAVFLKTDNKDLFNYSLFSFEREGFLLRNVTYDLHRSGFPDNIMTEYEQKFSEEGHPICRLEAYVE